MMRQHVKAFILALGLLVAASATCVTLVIADVWTDKPDYPPGATVTITGDGMLPGETVVVEVYFPDGTLAQSHLVEADQAGNFTDTYLLPPPEFPGVGTYAVVATGLTSGNVFTTTFEDGTSATSISPTKVSVVAGGDSASFKITTTITGSIGTGCSFSVPTVWTVSGGTCTGSSPVTYTSVAENDVF